MKDLINVYELIDTTTTSTTTNIIKKPSFNYEKPIGWDGKRVSAPKKKKMSIFKVLWMGILDDDFADVKNQKRYDNWMDDAILCLITALITFILIETVIHSGISSETYNPDRKITFSEKALDNVINVIKGEKKKPMVVPRKDTIYLPAQ